MARIPVAAATLAAVLLGASGCGPPTLTVRHTFPPDLPIPAEAKRVALGEFAVAGGPADAYGPFLARVLAECLEDSGAYTVATDGAADLVITAVVSIAAQDIETVRTVRRLEPETRHMEHIEVPALVRTAAVTATFEICREPGGERIAAAEIPRTYRSTADPRTRGPIGLDRADDPANIPPADTVIRELLASCADRFVEMLRPRQASVRIALRPAPGKAGAKGLEAARRGDYQAAADLLREALGTDPAGADLLFNLAAVLEADGRLQDALETYEKAGEDPAAREAAARVRRAIAWTP